MKALPKFCAWNWKISKNRVEADVNKENYRSNKGVSRINIGHPEMSVTSSIEHWQDILDVMDASYA